jgi:hypothetical protein
MAKTKPRPKELKPQARSDNPGIIAYTAVLGDRDKPRTDIPCFTVDMGFRQPVMNAKIFKILPHKFFHADISIWIDGNIFLNVSKEEVAKLLGDNDLAVLKHTARKNIYEEAEAIKQFYPRYTELVDEQIKCYREMGVPETLPLAECPLLIRRHNDMTAMFNEAWWAEICRFSPRDQLSFPVTVANFPDLKVKYIDYPGGIYTHPYFKRLDHDA